MEREGCLRPQEGQRRVHGRYRLDRRGGPRQQHVCLQRGDNRVYPLRQVREQRTGPAQGTAGECVFPGGHRAQRGFGAEDLERRGKCQRPIYGEPRRAAPGQCDGAPEGADLRPGFPEDRPGSHPDRGGRLEGRVPERTGHRQQRERVHLYGDGGPGARVHHGGVQGGRTFLGDRQHAQKGNLHPHG